MSWLERLFAMWAQYRLAKQERKFHAQNRPFEVIENIVTQLRQSQGEQTKVLQTWMESFQVHEMPKTSVVRDADEFTEEENRAWDELHAAGVPSGVAESVRNAIRAGSLADVKDMFQIPD